MKARTADVRALRDLLAFAAPDLGQHDDLTDVETLEGDLDTVGRAAAHGGESVFVDDTAMSSALTLAERVVEGEFRKGGLLDRLEAQGGDEVHEAVELGAALGRLGRTSGMESGWGAEDIHWRGGS